MLSTYCVDAYCWIGSVAGVGSAPRGGVAFVGPSATEPDVPSDPGEDGRSCLFCFFFSELTSARDLFDRETGRRQQALVASLTTNESVLFSTAASRGGTFTNVFTFHVDADRQFPLNHLICDRCFYWQLHFSLGRLSDPRTDGGYSTAPLDGI